MSTLSGSLSLLFRRGALTVLALLVATSTALAAPITYQAILNGPNESPANASAGTGFALVTLDTLAHTLSVDVTFQGLTAGTTASHIHCCTALPGTGTAGVMTVTPTFTGFPSGVTAGTYSHVFDTSLASAWNPSFLSTNNLTPLGAEAVLAAGLIADQAYLNIHTTAFPGGEIRGFLVPVPEPSSLLLLGTGGLAVVRAMRRRR